MKDIFKSEDISIPEGVKVEFNARNVQVTGPRGKLSMSFKHVNCEIKRIGKSKIRIQLWHGARKQAACIRTVASHIENMIKGVTRGYQYKMRFVYSHFPINANVVEEGSVIEIRNFLGEKIVRRVPMLEGVKVMHSTEQKDELILSGNSVENVSQSAANIQQSTLVKNKDIRKFLDGIYVSERGHISME
ncbi:60S ribosomal protein L9B [Sorochytrium milnesiophthora]